MDRKPGYAGSITHAGSQKVEAPLDKAAPHGKTVIHTGKDLRTGK